MATKQQKKFRVYVQYFIQNDPWESLAEPNLFVLPDEYTNLNDVKVEDVYNNFPLRDRFSLYLRFYLDDKAQSLNDWIDLPPSATLPIYNNGSVYVKVLRLPKGTPIQFKNDDIFQKSKVKKQEPTIKQTNSNQFSSNTEKDNQYSKQQMKETNANLNPKPQTSNIPSFLIPQDLDFGDISKELQDGNIGGNGMSGNGNNSNNGMGLNVNIPLASNITSSTTSSNIKTSKTPIPISKEQQNFNDLDNIWKDINFHQQSPKNKPSTFLDNNAFTIKPNDQSQCQSQGQPMSQQQQIPHPMPLHDLTGKNMMPIDKIPTHLSEDDMKERIEMIVRNWSMSNNVRKNVLLLLSTLHEVWTNDPSWTGVSTEELVNSQKTLNSKFRLAKACLHPDKNANKDFKTQYTASCLYQIFSEAKDLYK